MVFIGSGSMYLLGGGVCLVLLGANQDRYDGWPYLLEGIVGIGAGVIAAGLIAAMNSAALYALPIWALATGVLQGIEARRLQRETTLAWLLGATGLVSLLFGVYLAAGADPFSLWPWGFRVFYRDVLRVHALFVGVVFIVLGFRLRTMREHSSAQS